MRPMNGKGALYTEKFLMLERQGADLVTLLNTVKAQMADQRIVLANFEEETVALENLLASRPTPEKTDGEA